MCQILEARQIGQLNVQRVDIEPRIWAHQNYENPNKHDEYVVGKNEVIDNWEEEEGKETQNQKGRKRPQPWQDFLFVFL